MIRREQILQLVATIRNEADKAANNADSDSHWMLACSTINGAAAELVRLTRAEACAIVDAKMKA